MLACRSALLGLYTYCRSLQVPQGYAPFSPAQRLGAVLRNGAKLAAVGFGSSLIGVTATNVLVGARQMLDPAFVPTNAPQARTPPTRCTQKQGCHAQPPCALSGSAAS